jgi:hypothetical protein
MHSLNLFTLMRTRTHVHTHSHMSARTHARTQVLPACTHSLMSAHTHPLISALFLPHSTLKSRTPNLPQQWVMAAECRRFQQADNHLQAADHTGAIQVTLIEWLQRREDTWKNRDDVRIACTTQSAPPLPTTTTPSHSHHHTYTHTTNHHHHRLPETCQSRAADA